MYILESIIKKEMPQIVVSPHWKVEVNTPRTVSPIISFIFHEEKEAREMETRIQNRIKLELKRHISRERLYVQVDVTKESVKRLPMKESSASCYYYIFGENSAVTRRTLENKLKKMRGAAYVTLLLPVRRFSAVADTVLSDNVSITDNVYNTKPITKTISKSSISTLEDPAQLTDGDCEILDSFVRSSVINRGDIHPFSTVSTSYHPATSPDVDSFLTIP